MIRHIVMFSCKDRADVDVIYRGLSVLTQIPQVAHLEVALNEKIDQIGNDIDVIVYGEFASVEDFRAYKAHPLYEESIRRVRHLRDIRVAADYTVSNATRVQLPELAKA
ncbi:Dabb family protein [Asticcacaulis sp. AC402]|uniref:Dabb family protein n=1 Tax=Asticcacaulis sp. AC402 TaxID=1282361 RepID=UPI0003C3BE72|nr:Dabb family protein [Asticcacaulis sp. AC402]ESQ77766.1 stress responsive protein [Asticcacaulis sp. AC402]